MESQRLWQKVKKQYYVYFLDTPLTLEFLTSVAPLKSLTLEKENIIFSSNLIAHCSKMTYLGVPTSINRNEAMKLRPLSIEIRQYNLESSLHSEY